MIWLFTCPTKDCENNINPVFLAEVVNPVLCSLCGVIADAVETDQPAPTPALEEIPAPKTTSKTTK